MPKHILAFGNPVYDRIVTPVLTRTDRVLSGCSTNACLAAAKLGERTTLVGTVGPDYGEQLKADLAHWGVDAHLWPSRQTGGFSLLYDDRGNRELTVLGVADPIPARLNGLDPAQADIILIGPILGETSAELGQLLKAASPAPIVLDPQGVMRRMTGSEITHERTETFLALARLATVVKANELEAEVATGLDPRREPEAAVRALHALGCQIAIVTLAEAGSIIFDGQRVYTIPPYTTQAVDPTGAGDTYAAGFMVKYLETPDRLSEAGCFASAVASVMVENSGPAFPLTRAEAERRAQVLLDGPQQLKL